MKPLYTDLDKYCCKWLHNLQHEGLLPPGTVQRHDVKNRQFLQLDEHKTVHFFAGLGGWPLALEMAGWPRSKQVWTGSCPCQPWSVAGYNKGFDDARHLWPDWFYFIQKYRPECIFGEQVNSPAGRAWLDLVFSNLESKAYTCGAAVLPVASIGAPHERHRIFFVAHTYGKRWAKRETFRSNLEEKSGARSGEEFTDDGRDFSDASVSGHEQISRGLAHEDREKRKISDRQFEHLRSNLSHPYRQSSQWSAESWGQRRIWDVEPCLGRVANGIPSRVDKLRALGNAIVPQIAAEFVKAFMYGMQGGTI